MNGLERSWWGVEFPLDHNQSLYPKIVIVMRYYGSIVLKTSVVLSGGFPKYSGNFSVLGMMSDSRKQRIMANIVCGFSVWGIACSADEIQ